MYTEHLATCGNTIAKTMWIVEHLATCGNTIAITMWTVEHLATCKNTTALAMRNYSLTFTEILFRPGDCY